MTNALADLTQNMDHCWRCSHCKWVPSPQSQQFAKICPSMEWGNFHAYSGGGKVITAYALMKDAIPYTDKMLESVFACTMCGGCDTSCKNNNAELIEPLDILYALRARIASDGKSRPEHLALIENFRREGNPFGAPAADRALWAKGLDLKDATREKVDVLLHVGCDSAYTAQFHPELRSIVALLTRAGVDFGIACDAERATGELAYDLGFQDVAREQAKAMANLIGGAGAKTVVTCSASSYAAFRNIWPRLGVAVPDVRVQHITDFLEALFEERKLEVAETLDLNVTYHDPCKLGRLSEAYTPSDAKWTKVLNQWDVREPAKPILFGNDGLYDAPRKLLARITGVSPQEMERNRQAAWCCGGAGGARQAYPDFADFAAQKRIEEAEATGASVVVTASCACRRQLEGAAEESSIQVAGLFSLLADACGNAAVSENVA